MGPILRTLQVEGDVCEQYSHLHHYANFYIVGHLFIEGYKFCEKSKSTFSWKLCSKINISARAATYMIMINSCIYLLHHARLSFAEGGVSSQLVWDVFHMDLYSSACLIIIMLYVFR